MNPTQIRGKKWLQTNYGLKNEDLQFTGGVPTFTTKEGNFLTKRVVGKANQVAVFFHSEVQKLVESDPEKTTILLVHDSGEVTPMPLRALAANPTFKDIRLVLVESETNGRSGEILLHLSRRSAESSHYRVNHVPMESMLVYRDFQGHLSVSTTTGNGKPDFWLVLSPQMMA